MKAYLHTTEKVSLIGDWSLLDDALDAILASWLDADMAGAHVAILSPSGHVAAVIIGDMKSATVLAFSGAVERYLFLEDGTPNLVEWD